MADGASQSQVSMYAVLETTRGVTPTNPAYTQVPLTEGTSFLQLEKNSQPSRLIRPDREPGVNVGGVSGCNGSLQMELIREAGYQLWLESALSNVFAFVTASVASCTFAASGTKLVRAAGSWLTDALAARFRVGDTVFITGSASNATTLNGALNATATTIPVTSDAMFNAGGGSAVIDLANGSKEIIRYTGKSANSLTGVTRGKGGTVAVSHLTGATIVPGRVITSITATDLVFANDAPVTDAVAFTAAITANTRFIQPSASNHRFYTVEQKFGDVGYYEIYKGVEVNTMSHNLPTEGVVTAECSLLGTKFAQGQVAGSTYPNMLVGRTPMGASVQGSSLLVDGAALNSCIESLSFNINNNRALKYGVGESQACFVEEGRREIDLSFGVYLVDGAIVAKFLAETRIALEALTVSADGDKYRFTFPQVFLSSNPKQISGQTVTQNLSGRAEYTSANGATMFVHEIIAI